MKRATKKRWLKDLRSGEYKQGQSKLKDVDGTYCCLGVLADGAGRAELEAAGFVVRTEKDPTLSSALIIDSKEWGTHCRFDLGVHGAEALGITQDQQEALIHKNDHEHKDFKQIANWISRNIKPED